MSKWEYLKTDLSIEDDPIGQMNEMGDDGWELMWIGKLEHDSADFYCIFKRPQEANGD